MRLVCEQRFVCCLSRFVALELSLDGSQELPGDHREACKSPEYTASGCRALTAVISVAFDRTPDYVVRSTPNNVINDNPATAEHKTEEGPRWVKQGING